jgi:predicted dehydrogenase
VTRRGFLKSNTAIAAAAAMPSLAMRLHANKNSRLRVFQIGVGGIGGLQRKGLKDHKQVEFAGFCDVDSQTLHNEAKKHAGAFAVTDYREAFARHVDKFDAVIVDTPDFHHTPMMLTALKHNKHVYGQKPLVHQLDELRMMREALSARPDLFTQMGNQRACIAGRMQAVEMLRSNQLGRPVEAHIWTGSVSRGHYFDDPWKSLPEAKPVPSNLNWDLWRGPLTADIAYSDDIAPRRWRSYWLTGGGQLADWGCHLIDLLYFAYDLPSPEAVQTNTMRSSNDSHSAYNQSTLTYPGGKGFARGKFVLHYNDSGLTPSFAALGLPALKYGANHTMVVCEDGVLILEANGKIDIFRKGKKIENEPRPEVAPRDHWKDWADCCLGNKKPLWTPFDIGSRITEPALLAVKATRYPGEELRWDGKNYRFTNHDAANKEILKREYRKGFEPPEVA